MEFTSKMFRYISFVYCYYILLIFSLILIYMVINFIFIWVLNFARIIVRGS